MKQIMWGMGLNPLVIPNGIPSQLFDKGDSQGADRVRRSLGADLILSKVARFDPDKRWHMAVESVARLKARGLSTVLLARGGIEPHGDEVLHNARSMGLVVEDAWANGNTMEDYHSALEGHTGADIVNLRFHCPQEFLRVVYAASDAVLANSGHEPFGLVGLETMAAGGIAVTGGTGEDYAVPFYNAIVLETSDPAEIEGYVAYLHNRPDEQERIRRAGKLTASLFTWESAVENLTRKLEYQARRQRLLGVPPRVTMPEAVSVGVDAALPGLHPLPDLVPAAQPISWSAPGTAVH
jgi:glycosyltransferase involved in cell wall biosynthesis